MSMFLNYEDLRATPHPLYIAEDASCLYSKRTLLFQKLCNHVIASKPFGIRKGVAEKQNKRASVNRRCPLALLQIPLNTIHVIVGRTDNLVRIELSSYWLCTFPMPDMKLYPVLERFGLRC